MPANNNNNTPQTMRAMTFEAYGDIHDVVQTNKTIPVPAVGPKDVLIQVHSAGVNPVDWKIIKGYITPFFDLNPSAEHPATTGMDVSGVVVRVGSQVQRFKEGDAVYAMSPLSAGGSFAEYFALDESVVSLKPSSVSHAEASALPLVALTSYQALVEHAKLQKGERVLILGGSGGTGSVAIQLAHHIGAHVTTTCSGRNADYVRSLGADEVVDYTQAKYADVLAPHSFDVVYACTEGELSDVAKVVKSQGRFVNITLNSYEAPAGDSSSAPAADFIQKKFLVTPNGSQLDEIRKLVDANKLRVAVEQSFPLAETRAALEKSMSNRTRGKLVVSVL